MLRKVIAITATFVMLLTFAACNNKTTEESSNTRPAHQVLHEYTTEKPVATTTTATEVTTTAKTTTTTEKSTTEATTVAKTEGTTVASITTTAAKKQQTTAQTQAAKTQTQQQVTQPHTQQREEPAKSEATQPKTTTQAPVTTKATTVTTVTTPATTRATTPSTTTSTTTSTTPTTTSSTTTTTTTTTSITTTEATTTTTEPVTEPPVTTTVYEGPLFESMSNPYPEFDGLNFAWPEPVGTVTQRRASHDIQNFNYLEDIDCVVFYFDAYMSYLDYYHDSNHTWSNQAISYTNDYGDEIILYPDKNYISIYGQNYSVTSAFGLNYDTSRTCIISNGYEYFRFDFDKLYDICKTIANNVR